MIKDLTLTSILKGFSNNAFEPNEGEFTMAQSIDPDTSINIFGGGSLTKFSGLIYPVRSYPITISALNSNPQWVIPSQNTDASNSLWYFYLQNGRFISFDKNFQNETNIGTPTSGAGNGAAYYNNYIYLMTPTDVSRYGPLNNSPAITNTFWTSTLSKAALTNTSYPTNYPNHAPHFHIPDGKLYFCDFIPISGASGQGQGVIHFIKTKSDGTNAGVSDDGSTAQALKLPFGYYPFDIESWGTDLVIACSQTMTSNNLKQGDAVLFFWDTFSLFPYAMVPVKMSLCTALLNSGGMLHGWGGSTQGGSKKFTYSGGSAVEIDVVLDSGNPPAASAIDAINDTVAWAGVSQLDSTTPVVFTKDYSPSSQLDGALHCRASINNTSNTPAITALKFLYDNPTNTALVMGWSQVGDLGRGITITLDSTKIAGAGTGVALGAFVTPVWTVGQPFNVQKIAFNMNLPVTSADTIAVKLYLDSTSITLDTINSTNFNGKTNIVYNQDDITQAITTAGMTTTPQQTLFLNFQWAGSTRDNPIMLPVRVTIETLEDQR